MVKIVKAKHTLGLISILFASSIMYACSSIEVGSERWCENLKQQLDEDLTLEGTKKYTKHCLLNLD